MLVNFIALGARRLTETVFEDLAAKHDALIADIHAGTGDQLHNLFLRFTAKRADDLFILRHR